MDAPLARRACRGLGLLRMRNASRSVLLVVFALLVGTACVPAQALKQSLGGVTQSGAPWPGPVDPQATPEARRLLAEMDALSGQATLTGAHNFPNDGSRWSDRILELTGEFPALFGQDFGFSGGEDKDTTRSRVVMLAEVERQYRRGAVIALCWHAVPPNKDEPVTFHEDVQSHLTDSQWAELLTPDSPLNLRWQKQVDVIAAGLQQLQAHHVAVLFRPYHEINGNWFWWNGRPGPQGSAALYRMIFDRMVHVHGLHNLVWVFNGNSPSSNAGSLSDYDPGQAYADLYTIDVYGEFKQSYYDSTLALAKDKPIALAEVGEVPTPAVLATQPRWTYFMVWSGFAEDKNSPAVLNTEFHSPRLLNLGDPLLGPFLP